MKKLKNRLTRLAGLITILLLISGCVSNTYKVGGTVSGLLGSGLVLQNKGKDKLAISANGSFQFSKAYPDNESYDVTILVQPSDPNQICTVTNGQGLLEGTDTKSVIIDCGPNQDDPSTYPLSGTVSGLTGTGLVLQNNNGDDLEIDANGDFTFPTALADGSNYKVSVLTQPSAPNQICTVANAAGTINHNSVSNVEITCATNTYTINGNVSGLEGEGLILQNNNGDDLEIDANGDFTFPTALADGSNYSVTILAQPSDPNQLCTVAHAADAVNGDDVNNVQITCATNTYTLSGTVSGLTGSGLVLQNNQGDDLAIPANGDFTFATALADGSDYSVSVLAQPQNPSQTCLVSDGHGTLEGRDIIGMTVTCQTDTFTIGGTVSNLKGSGLVLQNNSGDDLPISRAGDFRFQTPLEDHSTYSVSILSQPSSPNQICTASDNSGNVDGDDVSSVAINCVTETYTVGITVNGLSGSGLVLQNNGGDDLPVSTDGSFTFTTPINDGSTYNVSVLTQPSTPNQACTITNASGVMDGAKVTNITLDCVTDAHTLGGTVSGLVGTGLVIQNNNADDLTINASGSFTLSQPYQDNSTYEITILTQPSSPNQTCSVTNGSGTISGEHVNDISIACITEQYTVSVDVSGLDTNSTSLILQNNGGDDLTINANGTFSFPAQDDGSDYEVTVLTQPSSPNQTCSVTNGSDTIDGADVTLEVECTTEQYTVSVDVSGLDTNSTSLILQNNGGDDLTINANGTFSFPDQDDGSDYEVTVLTQPSSPNQTCSVTNGSDTIDGADVTLEVECTTEQYTVSVDVSGLDTNSTSLILQNNGGDDLTINANGTFSFPAQDDGSPYNVGVFTQPSSPNQTCSVSSGSGTLSGANVINVLVTCTTNTFTVGGSVSGLTGSGLVLQNNNGDNLSVSSDGSFTFATALADGSPYNVGVFTQPSSPNQTCSVSNGSGTLSGANVTNVLVTCTASPAALNTSFGQGLSVSAAPKVLTFSWAETGADYYRLLKNPDGASGFTQLGDHIRNTRADEAIAVHWHNWVQASYVLESCDAQDNCFSSLPVGTGVAMQNAIGYFKASRTAAGAGAPGYQLGTSVALSADGQTLAVGAPVESANTGAVYVFSLQAGMWAEEARLTATNPLDVTGFGQHVALSEDGNTLAVGAPNDHTQGFKAGSVSVFTRTEGHWSPATPITALSTEAGDQFGSSIALSADGHTLAVGASAEDSAAGGLQGDQNNNGAPDAGAAYVFTRSGNSWSQQVYLKASHAEAGDQFGTQVALSGDGQTLAVSAPFESSSAWGVGGNPVDNSASESGAVYVFTENSGRWEQQAYLKASNTDAGDQFGTSLSLSSNGDTLAVSAQYEASNAVGIDGDEADNSTPGAGAVYVFGRSASTWSQDAYLKAANTEGEDFFGISTSLTADGNHLAVGAYHESSDATGANGDLSSNLASDAGAVYVFTRATNGWSQKTYLKASNTGSNDAFGQAVSFSADGGTLAVGAPGESSNATGIQGDQTNDSTPGAGAVYLY